MAAFRFDRLYAGGAWHAPGYLTVGDAGMVTAAGSEPPEGDIAEIGGINYSNGNDLSLRMYRIAP